MRVGDLAPEAFADLLGAQGAILTMAPLRVRVRSTLRTFAVHLRALYQDYGLAAPDAFADVDVRMVRVRPGRPWHAERVQFVVDGVTPFDAMPLVHAVPMFEWGLNWVFAQRTHAYLLLHAAAVARAGRGLLLPAYPGSGKSTLAASLACRGWRYLSDEFGAVAGGGRELVPFVRPAAIKNAAIDVLRAFAPDAQFGEIHQGTRKGTVAHLRPPVRSVVEGATRVPIDAVAFPEFRAGAEASLVRLGSADAFMRLAGHAFNYEVLGERGFRAVTAIVRRCACYALRYGDLDAAHAALATIAADAPVAA